MTKLSVNVNKVALLRNARTLDIPSVLQASEWCLAAGAHGITVHPRPDERHIRRQDVRDLKQAITVELNVEGNPLEPHFMDLVLEVVPAQCTLVPDASNQATSDHGWDVVANAEVLKSIIGKLKAKNIRASLFVDPDVSQIDAVKAVGADRIELYTEPFASAFARGERESAVAAYRETAIAATKAGLGINAGHDLNLDNLTYFLTHVPGVEEVSIGHALIADALQYGLAETTRRYLAAIQAATPSAGA